MTKLNIIAQEILAGKISLKEGGLKTMLVIYENRKYFGLYQLDKDTFHDFLLFEYEHFLRIFKTFDSRKGTFSTFYIHSMQNSLRAFIRRIAKRNAIENAYESSKSFFYEEQAYDYWHAETETLINIFDEDYFNASDYISKYESLRKKQRGRSNKNRNKISDSFITREHRENFHKTACLVLVLKSCFNLTDSLIKKASVLTNVSEDNLLKMAETAKEKTWSKKKAHDKIEQARDNAYFYSRRYQQEMMQMEDEMYKKSKQEKYLSQTKKWQERNNHLQNMSCRITPTNKVIGQILHIPSHRVGYVLREIKKMESQLSLVNKNNDEQTNFIDRKQSKQYNSDYENLPSNRKQKQKTGNSTNSSGTSDCNTF